MSSDIPDPQEAGSLGSDESSERRSGHLSDFVSQHLGDSTPSTQSEPIRTHADASYRSAQGVQRVLLVLLAAWVVFGSVAAAASLVEYRLLQDLISAPETLSFADLIASDDRQTAIAVTWIIGYLITGMVFIVWMRRVYINFEDALQRGHLLRFSRGWTIGGWFVPFLNLARPKQIVDDLWEAGRSQASTGVTAEWPLKGSRLLVHVWWGVWILTGVIGWSLFRLPNETMDAQGLSTLSIADVAFDVITAGTAVAAIVIVSAITFRQETAASEAFIDYHPPSWSLTTGRAWRTALVLGAVAVVTLVAGLAMFDGRADGSPVVQGSSSALDALQAGCEDGSMLDCDMLWLVSSVGSDYEAVGATCGGTVTSAHGPDTFCTASVPWQLADYEPLMGQCETGFNIACDLLFYVSPVGSPGERIGATCGGRSSDSNDVPPGLCTPFQGIGTR